MPTKEEMRDVFDAKIDKLEAERLALEQQIDDLCRKHDGLLAQIKLLAELGDELCAGTPVKRPILVASPPINMDQAFDDLQAERDLAAATAELQAPERPFAFNMPKVIPSTKPLSAKERKDEQRELVTRIPMSSRVTTYVTEHPGLRPTEIARNMASFVPCEAKDPEGSIAACISSMIKQKKLFKHSDGTIVLFTKDLVVKTAPETSESPILSGALDRIATFLRVRGSSTLLHIVEGTELPEPTIARVLLEHEDSFLLQGDRYTVIR